MKTTYMTIWCICAKSLMMKLMLVVGMVICCGNLVWGAEVTFTASNFSGQGTISSGSPMTATSGGITVSTTKGYADTNHIREYSGGSITVSSTYTITNVVFTATESKYAKLSNVTWSGTTGTWTGSATSITFNATYQSRISRIVITYTVPTTGYTVSFDYGAGSSSTIPATTDISETYAGAGITLPSATPPAGCDPEYTFYGWSTEEVNNMTTTPTTIVGEAEDTYHPSEDNITLYAVYAQTISSTNVEKTYGWESGDDATFWDFSNMISDGSISAHGGSNYGKTNVTATAYIKTANKITNPISIECYYSKTTSNTNSSSKFSIRVSFDGSSWTNVTDGLTFNNVTQGTWYRLSADLSSYENYYIEVYYSGTTAVRALDDVTIMYVETVSVYNTSPLCNIARVTYDANEATSGSVPVDGNSPYTLVNGEANVTVLDNTGNLEKTGHTFSGWTDGNGNNYEAGDEFTITGNTILYAIWTPNTYSVTWYANGSAVESLSIDYGKSFLEDGYEIDGLEYIDGDAEENACDEMYFVGWSEERFDAYDGIPTLLQYNQIVGIEITGDKNYYAVFATRSDEETWNQVTTLADITDGLYVIVSNGFYLPNTTTSSAAPVATTLVNTINDGVLEGTITSEMQWNFIKSNSQMEIRPNIENTSNYLYEINQNNGIRVSSTRDTWSFTNNGSGTFSMKGTNYNRYCATYTSDWRSYTSPTHSNYGDGGRVYLYKYGYTYSNYTTFCPCDYELENLSDGDMVWAGKNGPTNQWSLASNWVVYHTSDSKYHLTNEAPSNCNVYVKYVNDEGGCIINVKPLLTSDIACTNLTISSNMGINLGDNNLTITGNLTNDGSAIYGTGSVIFAGTSPQTISGATTFGNVEFNNANGITADAEPIINGEATFSNGAVTGDVVFGEDATVSGVSTSSYVDGKVTKNGSANSTDFFFPTGSNGNLGKVEVSSDVSGVSVQYYSNPAGFSSSDLPRWWASASVCGLDHVSNVEYWKIETSEPIEATFTAQASTDMHFNGATGDRNPDNIQMAFYGSNCWSSIAGEASVEGNTITIENVSVPVSTRSISGNYIAPASKSKSTILPIELVSFSATCNGKSTNLAWTTASERNNDYFIVERSYDAINFTEIARVAGAGNSIEQLDYKYADYSATSGDNYYRLVQVDYDGTRTASEIVVASCHEAEGEPEVHVFPNPFHNDVTIHIENLGGSAASIEVYDMLGRMVMTKTIAVDGNSEETMLQLGDLSNGTYNVRISTADFVVNRKVVKE